MEQSLTSWKWELVINLPTSFSEVDVSDVFSIPAPHRVLMKRIPTAVTSLMTYPHTDSYPSLVLCSLPHFPEYISCMQTLPQVLLRHVPMI